MSQNKINRNQIIKKESNALARAGNTLKITEKIIEENNERLIVSEIKSVKIGDQIWMTENLNVGRFRNGDPIPEARTDEEWEKAGQEGKPAWCFNENDPNNEELYGRLYNWFAVTDHRGLTPMGWHIPSDEEWEILCDSLGGSDLAGKKMKNDTGWDLVSEFLAKYDMEYFGDSGTNESGLKFFPGGARDSYGRFWHPGYDGYFWTSTLRDKKIWRIAISQGTDRVSKSSEYADCGLSIRCIKDC